MKLFKKFFGNSSLQKYSAELVRAAYLGVLDREPDPAGLTAYVRTLESTDDLPDLITELIHSDEFFKKNSIKQSPELVSAIYKGLLGREPDSEALKNYTEKFAETRDLAELVSEIAQNEKDQKLEEKISGQGLMYGEIINALYIGIFRRPADKGGFESYLSGLQKGIPLSDIIQEMVTSDEFKSR